MIISQIEFALGMACFTTFFFFFYFSPLIHVATVTRSTVFGCEFSSVTVADRENAFRRLGTLRHGS